MLFSYELIMEKQNSVSSLNAKRNPVKYSKLIALAKKMRATSITEANGTCLVSSLEFCIIANKLNIPATLVMWHVKRDPTYCDHWAVSIEQNQIIDLTRIQIDSKLTSNVVFSLNNYPDNFSKPRFYETALLLDEYLNFKEIYSDQLPPLLIRNLRYLMLKQDLSNANKVANFSSMAFILLSYSKFRITFGISGLHERLQKKLKKLTEHI